MTEWESKGLVSPCGGDTGRISTASRGFTCWVLSIIASASAISFWFIPQRLATFVWHRWWTFMPHAERKKVVREEQGKKPRELQMTPAWGSITVSCLWKKVCAWHRIWDGLWREAWSWRQFYWSICWWFYWLGNARIEEGALSLQSGDWVFPFPAALGGASAGRSLSWGLSLKKGNGQGWGGTYANEGWGVGRRQEAPRPWAHFRKSHH